MDKPFRLRVATNADIPTLLELMLVSSHGGIRTAWERVRSEGETWRQRGLAELGNAACEIGYTRFIVSEIGDRVAGMMLINMIGRTDDLNPNAEPPEQRGAVALIKAARHSVFIRELAIFDWARGQGLGQSFIDLAANLATSNNHDRVTLIVNDANGPAHKLYVKTGFAMTAAEASIGHPTFPDGSMLLLMERKVVGP
jgi:ribosomal protein S18 acetylase RimI-like enzyme